MSVPVVALFNNKGGVGKTSVAYHLAWIYADQGVRVVVADLDPQANLTVLFCDEDDLESIWSDSGRTIHSFIEPLIRGVGDIKEPVLLDVHENLALVAGDLALSAFEDDLSLQWPQALSGHERAFRVLSAFYRVLQNAAKSHKADLVLVDLGPNLGSINRAGLISADHVVIPVAPDLLSLQGLRNLGPTFGRWRSEWTDRLARKPAGLELPAGKIHPLGYVVLQHSVRFDRPIRSYDRWIQCIPNEYRCQVLSQPGDPRVTVHDDPNKLALLKHYRSLMPMAQEARKPIFHLKPADGAIGAHLQGARDARKDFLALAEAIRERL